MIIVRTKVRLISTPKNFKKIAIWSFIIKKFKKGFDMCDRRGEPINQVNGCEKNFIPIFLRNRGRGKKMITCLNNVTVLSLNKIILLMCMCEKPRPRPKPKTCRFWLCLMQMELSCIIVSQEIVQRNLLLLFSHLGQGFYHGSPTYLIGEIRKPN